MVMTLDLAGRRTILDDREITPEESLMLDGLDQGDVARRYNMILVEMRMALYGSIWREKSDFQKVMSIVAAAELELNQHNFYLEECFSLELSGYINKLNAVLDYVCKPHVAVEDYPALLLFLSRTKAKLGTFPTLGEI